MAETGRRERARTSIGIALALPFLIAGAIIAFQEYATTCTPLNNDAIGRTKFSDPPCTIIDDDFIYFMNLETSAGNLQLVLDPIIAPLSVNNVVFLTRAGYYDDTVIHRIEVTEDEHSFIQIGDRTGTGRGFPGYMYGGDLPSPITRYTRGAVAMANANDDPRTKGSQFFIVGDDYEALSYPARQPNNTLIGFVADERGLAVLDSILSFGSPDGTPQREVRIINASITEERRFGEDEDEAPSPDPDDGSAAPSEGSPSPSPTDVAGSR